MVGAALSSTARSSAPVTPIEVCEAAREKGWRSGANNWVVAPAQVRERFDVPPEARARFAELLRAYQEVGIVLVVVPIPPHAMVWADKLDPWPGGKDPYEPDVAQASYDQVVAWFRKQGVEVVDVGAVARRPEHRDTFFSVADTHWTVDGARAVGQEVAKTIRSHSRASTLPKVDFVTHPRKPVTKDPPYIPRKVAELCGTTAPKMVYPRYATERAQALGLTDEVAPADVVLLGTSYSGEYMFNFAGFIREALSADVLSVPIAGGGSLASMRTWLRSPAYREHKPTFVVWEFPVDMFEKGRAQDVQELAVYDQLIPSVYGSCAANHLADSRGSLSGTRATVLDALETSGRTERDYLHLEFDNKGIVDFTVTQKDGEGKAQSTAVKTPSRVDDHGQWFLTLDPTTVGVQVEAESALSGAYTARVCRPL